MRFIMVVFVLYLAAVASVAAAQTKSAGQGKNDSMEGSGMKMSGDSMKMSGDMQKEMKAMNQSMVEQLGAGDKNYDARFIDMMISHHEGAVMMAQDALKKSERKEIRDMATKMIKEQKQQI